jgi:hypothetical protein
MNTNPDSEWLAAEEGWRATCQRYPVLGLRPTIWRFNNFLRNPRVREVLEEFDALRHIAGKTRIVHAHRFPPLVFDLLTGKDFRKEPINPGVNDTSDKN